MQYAQCNNDNYMLILKKIEKSSSRPCKKHPRMWNTLRVREPCASINHVSSRVSAFVPKWNREIGLASMCVCTGKKKKRILAKMRKKFFFFFAWSLVEKVSVITSWGFMCVACACVCRCNVVRVCARLLHISFVLTLSLSLLCCLSYLLFSVL